MEVSMRPLLLVSMLLLSTAVAARAQEIAPQSRVRIFLTPQRDVEGYAGPQVLRGTLLEMEADSLTLQVHPATSPMRVAKSAVRRIYVSRGVPSRAASAAMGAVGGALVGAFDFWVFNEDQFGSDREAALTGAAAGAGLGLVAGALWPRERWHRVRLPTRVSIAPAAEGTRLALSITR
jgi:hypothetical protein